MLLYLLLLFLQLLLHRNQLHLLIVCHCASHQLVLVDVLKRVRQRFEVKVPVFMLSRPLTEQVLLLFFDLLSTFVDRVQLIHEVGILDLLFYPVSSFPISDFYLLDCIRNKSALHVSDVLLMLLLLFLLVLDLVRKVVSDVDLLLLLVLDFFLLFYLVQMEIVLLQLVPDGYSLLGLQQLV